jgi:hypothetical protein
VKSADAVAAVAASGLSFACHTAPLWPRKVPILSRVGKHELRTIYRTYVPVAGLAIAKHRVSVFRALACLP